MKDATIGLCLVLSCFVGCGMGTKIGMNISDKACEEDFAALNQLDRMHKLCEPRNTGIKHFDQIQNELRAEICHDMLHR